MCIGELYLQMGTSCEKHLIQVMDLIMFSCEGVIKLNDMAYADILQDNIIETLMCIFHGMNNGQPYVLLTKYIPYVF
jgi:hypothetical protein